MILLVRKYIISIVFLTFLFTPFFASAKLDLIYISTNPETPAPNQDVQVMVESYAIPLTSAKIIWYIDGVALKEGIAEKVFNTRTKDFGVPVTIDIVILTADGTRYDKQIVLKPEEVDLLWEANTYVPPFYKGKALPTYKSTVKVTAIPRFNSLSSNPSEYYYKWSMNRTTGLGEALSKNSTVLQVGWADSRMPVSVDVTIPGSDFKATAIQYIPVTEARTQFYELAPLLGIQFHRAISGTVVTNGTDFRLRVVPYYFSNENYETGELNYKWKTDAGTLPATDNPNMLVLEKKGTAAEATTILLEVQNRKRILQVANTRAVISFTEETN